MGRTLTLKNLPDALHARLTAAAKRHRRSLNNEAILCLEAGMARTPATLEQRLTLKPYCSPSPRGWHRR